MIINLLRNNGPILTMIVIFLIDFFLIFSTHVKWNNSINKLLPLQSNILYLKSELSIGHLWLEELLAGDRYINIQKDIIDKFKNEKFKNYLKVAQNELNKNTKDKNLLSKLLHLDELSSNLHRITIQRLKSRVEYKTGSKIDQIFDMEFNSTLKQIDEIDDRINKQIVDEIAQRDNFFKLIILLFICINIIAFFLLLKNKNERTKYEKRLFKEKKKAEVTLYSIGDAVITTDEKGIVQFLNPVAQKLTGYSLNEAKKEKFEEIFDIFNTQSGKKVESPIVKVIKEGVIVGLANGTSLRSKNGDCYVIEDSAAPIVDEKGILIGTVIVFHDVTEQTKLRKELSHRQKMIMQQSKLAAMGEMLENIAHQWRQPLSAITTAASGMKVEKEYGLLNDEMFSKNIDAIISSSNFLSRTIDDLKDFFKPQHEKVIFDMRVILLNALSIVNSKLEYNNIKIIKESEKISIKGYSSELLQILTSLINNSIEAFLNNDEKSNRFIFIECTKKDNHAYICIRDNAGGFDKAELHRIFEPYFTTKHKYQGKGMGLFMVQEIIEKHMYGRINVSNKEFEYKGKSYKGLEFLIKLKLK